ncbi:hypothetical protein ACT6P6_24010 [Priestia endophytica]
MILKAIDLGLMAEHLTTHKGVLKKLMYYYHAGQNAMLKQIIYKQFLIMCNHVQVMILLIDLKYNDTVSVSALKQIESIELPHRTVTFQMGDKNILVEARHTAQSMALDNFSSALKMKTFNVKQIHIEMALQQIQLQEQYSELGKTLGIDYSPDTSLEIQIKTLEHFKKLFHMKS